MSDTILRPFKAPQDKLDKLEQILKKVTETGSVSFEALEKLARKCTSMPVAVAPVVLYTHFIYKQIVGFRRRRGSKINTEITVAQNSGLRFEVNVWLEVRHRMDGVPWDRAVHHVVSLTGATEASSGGWGSLIRRPKTEVFEVAGDFPGE